MRRLIGKKVWVIQYDDEGNSILGWCEGIDDNFIAIRADEEEDPGVYVNLDNVREIEVFRPEGEGDLRYLRPVPNPPEGDQN